ncbi:hypothetical protein M422DRAFT_272139 [Sphaerobolus stellatus SS14]|uniref:MULE transposase domain-containing protein n=1 Tax=Sphaerobolus stellatus (strain SS14) TaxID=990650 RepID=A0A0C9TY23_SPHS4|nr:hypothetical protein M422DRAFT_272139 [Sphaerobolus stellatus SS14]
MKDSCNPDAVWEWLDKRVMDKFNSKAIKAMLRMSSEELSEISTDSEALPYSIKVSAMDIYNAEQGWLNSFEPTPGEGDRNGFTMAFCSPWQAKLIAEYGDTVCLDSTHNTCRGENKEKIFLNTVLTRDHVTGRGVPLAFMLTNLESHFPFERFLKWLRQECNFEPTTFDRPVSILYCYWHLWQAWEKNITSKNMRCKENHAEFLKNLRTHLANLLRGETQDTFDKEWEFFQIKYGDQRIWLRSMEEEWIRVKERWATRAWRTHAHYGIDTDNFIESWY